MGTETSQTLDRGLQVLELLSDHPEGLTVTDIAAKLGVGRTVVYRLVATLDQHGFLRVIDGFGAFDLDQVGRSARKAERAARRIGAQQEVFVAFAALQRKDEALQLDRGAVERSDRLTELPGHGRLERRRRRYLDLDVGQCLPGHRAFAELRRIVIRLQCLDLGLAEGLLGQPPGAVRRDRSAQSDGGGDRRAGAA